MHRSLPPTGASNAITDVPGIRVGQAEDPELATGVTVILPDRPAVAAIDVRGGGPGTRESDALGPGCTIETVDAVVLSGGSAFGLDAAGGVADWLRTEGRGFAVGPVRVPVVPAAILFDLLNPEPREWQDPPWWRLGRSAVAAADGRVRLGNAGAGLGARAGALKGGIGTASFVTPDWSVGALAAVNALGSAVMPGTACFWTWWLERDGELGGQRPPVAAPEMLDWDPAVGPARPRANTTLAVVATDAALTRPMAMRVAAMAHDGLARALRPAHAPLDGDTVFAISTGARPLGDPVADLTRLGSLAADALSRAVMRGVYAAEPLGNIPAYRDLAQRPR